MASKEELGRERFDGQAILGLIILVAMGYGLWWWWQSAPPLPTYEYRISRHDAFGCLDREDVERLQQLAAQQDSTAFLIHAGRLVVTGRCPRFTHGEDLIVETYSGWREMYLARRRGDPQAYWFLKAFVSKQEVATPIAAR